MPLRGAVRRLVLASTADHHWPDLAPLLLPQQAPPWPLFVLGDALASRWLPQLQAALLPPHLHVVLLSSAFVSSKGALSLRLLQLVQFPAALLKSAMLQVSLLIHEAGMWRGCRRVHNLPHPQPATPYCLCAALYTAARLGVAYVLQQQGPLPAPKLASRLDVKEDALARVLHCLTAHGVFTEVCGWLAVHNAAVRMNLHAVSAAQALVKELNTAAIACKASPAPAGRPPPAHLPTTAAAVC